MLTVPLKKKLFYKKNFVNKYFNILLLPFYVKIVSFKKEEKMDCLSVSKKHEFRNVCLLVEDDVEFILKRIWTSRKKTPTWINN